MLVSTDVSGSSSRPVWSTDGSQVALVSRATDLLLGVSGFQVYAYHRTTASLRLVSSASDGTPAAASATLLPANVDPVTYQRMVWSPDSTKVLLSSNSWNPTGQDINYFHLFAKDLASGALTLISSASDGTPSNGTANLAPMWNPDGTKAAFTSFGATNLAPSSIGGVFVKDLTNGGTTLVSTETDGTPMVPDAFLPVWSPDPEWIAFVARLPGGPVGNIQVFRKNLSTGERVLVSSAADGTPGNGDSSLGEWPRWSSDGTWLGFRSNASNLVTDPPASGDQLYASKVNASPPPPPPPPPGPCAGKDAALIGVRGSGDPADPPSVLPGRHARAIARYLNDAGLRLFDNNDDDQDEGVIGLDYDNVDLFSPEAVLYGPRTAEGASKLLGEISDLRSKCGTDFPILLAGFSQGAHVIQSALEQLDDRADATNDATWESVAGVALLASPRFDPDDLAARGTFAGSAPRFGLLGKAEIRDRFSTFTRTYCLADDPVCQAPRQAIACLALPLPAVVACLKATIYEPWKTIHSQRYCPTSGEPPCEDRPLLQDAAELLRWAVERQGLPTPPNPIGELEGYRDFPNRLNTRVSAGSVYARGAPTTLYEWDFNTDGVIDHRTVSPFVVHAYGIGIGLRGFATVTTTVHIQHIDGSETTRSICIRRAPSGSATC